MSDLVMTAADAEVSLLGAAMSGYPDLDELLDTVEPRDFYSPLHEDIWAAIARVHRAGNQPDPVSVRLALAADPPRGFDPVRLVEIASLCPLIAQAPYYAEQVVTAAGLRRIADAGMRLQQIGNTPGDIDERREQARQAVDDATRGKGISKARKIADFLPDVIEVAENGLGDMLGTGWPDLDRVIGGLAPGRLVVVGARPGGGKSLMGTNLALHFAGHHNHAVLIASMEMPEREVGQRLLAAHASVNLSRLAEGKTDDREWQKIAAKLGDLSDMPITVDDASGQTITSIRSAARTVQRQRDDLALIVVDYLQLVRPSERRGNRAEEVAEISRGLKLLARESGACVVAMAQLNREGMKHSDGKPRMTDLRESGAIEADADQVILLHQPDGGIPEIEVIVEKNRHGPKGIVRLQIAGHYAQLNSIAWNPTRGIA